MEFCVPSDIASKIRAHRKEDFDEPISTSNVILWSISETLQDLRRNGALWSIQGRRHARHKPIWDRTRTDVSFDMAATDAKEFLEQEALSLSERYALPSEIPMAMMNEGEDTPETDQIADRLLHFGVTSLTGVTLHEEQERELSPEIEQERQVEQPEPATAEEHSLHKDVVSFARTGVLLKASEAFLPAFDVLQRTSAAAAYRTTTFPTGVLVTKDFATTIKSRTIFDQMDIYQRSVQWIITGPNAKGSGVEILLIISPYEAYHLLPIIKEKLKVTLHIYSPCLTEGSKFLDHLNLYTEGRPFDHVNIPKHLVIQLNLFAGQLYFESYKSYYTSCDYLGLRWKISEDMVVDGDGFIFKGGSQSCTFKQSPVKVLELLAGKIRRHSKDISRTHLGKLLGGVILDEATFATKKEDTQVGK